MSSSRLRIKLAVGISLVALPTALLGFAHTPAGRPLLARLGGSRGGCPVGASVTPAQLEAQRAAAMAPLRGLVVAPSRPALGLSIDKSTPAEVRAWATELGMQCEAGLIQSAVRCEGAVAAGAIRDVYARFDEAERLVALDVFRAGATGALAAARFEERQRLLASDLGPPSDTSGEATAAYLEAGPLRRAAIAYRFRDFAADVSVINQASSGVVLREQYRSIPTRSGS
ncbi:MAG: hypothetical protein ABJE95_18005 [Byssovorax sp.]